MADSSTAPPEAAAADPPSSRYSRRDASLPEIFSSNSSTKQRPDARGHPRGTEPAPPQSAGSESASEDSGGGIILDSGAAVHATPRADLLSELRPAEEGTVVRTRVGASLAVLAVGCVRTAQFVVPQVHHAPDLKNGCDAVVSVRQLTRQGLAVTFGSESCSVKEQSTGAVVGEGRLREEDGFYHLDYLRVPQS